MAHELTQISGIGDAAAGRLSDAGFATIEDIARATPESLGAVHGFGPARAATIIAAARGLVDVDEAEEAAAEIEAPAAPEPEADPIIVDVKEDDQTMTEKTETETETQVDPVVADAANKKFAALRKPQTLAVAAAVVAGGLAAANAETVGGFFDYLRTAVPPIAATDDAVEEKTEVAALTPTVPVAAETPAAKAAPAPAKQAKTAAPKAKAPTTAKAPATAPRQAAHGMRPYYPVYAPWNATPWNNAYYGNGAGNGQGTFSVNMTAKGKTAANGYGYQHLRPVYAPAYGYVPYAYPQPLAQRPAAKPAKQK